MSGSGSWDNRSWTGVLSILRTFLVAGGVLLDGGGGEGEVRIAATRISGTRTAGSEGESRSHKAGSSLACVDRRVSCGNVRTRLFPGLGTSLRLALARWVVPAVLVTFPGVLGFSGLCRSGLRKCTRTHPIWSSYKFRVGYFVSSVAWTAS
jgi:hypothetical protein